MPESRIDKEIVNAISFERYKAAHIRKIMPILNKLSKDIFNILLRMDEGKSIDVNNRLRRINRLIDVAFRKIEALSIKDYKELINHVQTLEETSIAKEGEEKEKKAKEKAQVNVILASLILGKSFKNHLAHIKDLTKANISSQVRTGIADNENITTIAKRVRGTRGRRFRDGVFNVTLNHVDSVIRTSIQTFINRTKQRLWKVRGIKRYIWIAVLDSHTSPICRGRSNNIYIVGEGPLPPAHYRCRSIVVAFIEGMEIPQSYSEWIRKQPRKVVEDILGKAKAALFLSGKLPLNKFTVPSGRELTIEELTGRG